MSKCIKNKKMHLKYMLKIREPIFLLQLKNIFQKLRKE